MLKNNKFISYSGVLKRGDITYKVNAKKSGLFNQMLHKGLNQLELMLKKHKRVLVLRFDLRQKYYTNNNERLRKFNRNLKDNLNRHYDFKDIGYWWVREIEKSKHQHYDFKSTGYAWAREQEIKETGCQHYHFVLFLDANKVQTSHKVLEIVEKVWTKTEGNTIGFCKDPYYFIDNGNTKAEAIYRISYLAKTRSKGYRDPQAKDYGTSRLR